MRQTKLIIFSWLIFLSYPVFAERQDFMPEVDETIYADISYAHLNRITIQDDGIIAVRAAQGDFLLDENSDTGDLFVKPTFYREGVPLHLFVDTYKGHSFSLVLSAGDRNAQIINIIPPQYDAGRANRWETNSTYEQTLIELIQTMARGERIDGFRIEAVDKPIPPKNNQVTVQLLQRYTGSNLVGEIYRIENLTREEVYLSEDQVFWGRELAISIDGHRLPASSFVYAYRVLSNG